MDITVRNVRPEDMPQVKAIYQRVHISPKGRTDAAWFMIPTLVALVHEGGEIPDWVVAGYTSGILQPDKIFHNLETCILPEYHGLGIGKRLFAARMQLARDAGAEQVIGATEDANIAMVKIAEECGMHACQHRKLANGTPITVYAAQL